MKRSNRIVSLVLSALLCLSCCGFFPLSPAATTGHAEAGRLRGDVNADGKVNSGDARQALRFAARLDRIDKNSAGFLAADVNEDGRIDSKDARKILRVAAKLESFENGPAGFSDPTVLYRPILDMYYKNILNGWSGCDYENFDNILDPDSVNGQLHVNDLKEIGYALIDIDGNGTPELLLSTPEAAADAQIGALYYIADNTVKSFQLSFGGSALSLCSDHRLSVDVIGLDMQRHAVLSFDGSMDACTADEYIAWSFVPDATECYWVCYEGRNIRLYEENSTGENTVSPKYIRSEDITLVKTAEIPEGLEYPIEKQPYTLTLFSEYAP